MIRTQSHRITVRSVAPAGIRCQHAVLERGKQLGEATKLNYAHRSVPGTFGQVVEDAELALRDSKGGENVRVVEFEELRRQHEQPVAPDLLNTAPRAPGLSVSQRSRLDPSTVDGKSIGGKMLVMQSALATRVNEGLQYFDPQKVRANTSKYYVALQNGGAHKASVQPIDVDTHVAGVFLQNYASAYNVLSETRRRVGKEWRPTRVLDVGFGPATGMVAFNEVFADEVKAGWRPETKTAVVIGHAFMLKRARAILSAQTAEDFYKAENRINTKIQGHMPQPKNTAQKYDLIMATHQLFRGAHNFPASVDDHTQHLLNLLAPGGVLVLVERGDPNGFETIARARQIMFRPEDYEHSEIKTPRVWKSGRNIKDTPTTTTATAPPLTATEDDPDFELPPELLAEFSVEEENSTSSTAPDAADSGYQLEIVAPCSHHGKCPLQIGQEARTKDTSGVFNWCKFAQLVQRPKFSVELKKGVFLATKWSTDSSGRGETGKGLGGSGRPNGRGHETSTFSYLVVKRPSPSPSSWLSVAEVPTARIMKPPMKRDAHVIMEVCAPTAQIEQWTVPKSFGKQAYHDARKASGGDLWALGAKTRIPRVANAAKLAELLARQAEKQKNKSSKAAKTNKSKSKTAAAAEAAGEAKPDDGVTEAEAEAAADAAEAEQDLEASAWHTRPSLSGGSGVGGRHGRKRVTTSLRGHDPDPLGLEGDGDSLEAYFSELGEIEKNSSRYRQYERKLKRGKAGAEKKKGRRVRLY